MSATGGRGGDPSQARPRKSLVESEVDKHTTRPEFDPSMITVTHTPNGIVTHVVTAESATLPVVRMEQGLVVTKVVTGDFGTVLAVLGGPAVVEVALHFSAEQRDRYAEAVARVDQEAMSHVMVASRTAVLTILQHLGMPAEQPAGDTDAAAAADSEELW